MTTQCWQNLSEDDRAEFWATLALRHSQGLGPRLSKRLLAHFGSAYTAIQALDKWEKLNIKTEITKHVSSGAWRESALVEWRDAQKCDANIVLWHHAEYPKLLQTLVDAPTMLYARGDLSLLNGPCMAVVGSRKCSSEGVQVAGNISRDLASAGIVIVSGMARGIDRVAHMAALHKVGKSIAVLGTGIDIVYPKCNADLYNDLWDAGLIISEFAPNSSPIATNFPIRNRIISGISIGVLVVEGTLRSGTLITARQALEQNRDVFAIPGAATALTSQGCQELIRQGAKVVFTAEDILCDVAEQLKTYSDLYSSNEILDATASKEIVEVKDSVENLLQTFSDTEQQDIKNILKFLYGNGESHVDVICTELEKTAQDINSLLVSMELAGLVKRLAGARYVASSAAS